MDGINELKKKGTKTMANLPGSIKNLNTLLGEQLLEGGGSGGGGSSDFSTAEVTSSADSEGNITISAITEIGPNKETVAETSLSNGRTKTAVLYQGHQYVNITPAITVTVVSGSAEVLEEIDPMFGTMHFLDITGDCTITIS